MTITDILLLVFAATCFLPSLQKRIGWAIGGFKRNFVESYKDGQKSTKVEVEVGESK